MKLTEEEIEELRAKKQAIKEALYDDVKMEMFKASSKLEGIDYEEHMKAGTIEVKDYVEHEDGSATLVVDTDKDATRLLVEVGLRRLLEMAMKNEEGYEFKDEAEEVVPEATDGSVQEEVG